MYPTNIMSYLVSSNPEITISDYSITTEYPISPISVKVGHQSEMDHQSSIPKIEHRFRILSPSERRELDLEKKQLEQDLLIDPTPCKKEQLFRAKILELRSCYQEYKDLSIRQETEKRDYQKKLDDKEIKLITLDSEFKAYRAGKRKECDFLKTDNASKKRRIEELEDSEAKLHEKIKSLENVNNNQRDTIKDLENRRSKNQLVYRDRLSQKNKVIQNLEKIVDINQQKLNESARHAQAIELILKEKNLAYENLQKLFRYKETVIPTQKTRCEELEDRLTQLQQIDPPIVNDKTKNIHLLEEQIDELIKENLKKEEELQKQLVQIDQLNQQLELNQQIENSVPENQVQKIMHIL